MTAPGCDTTAVPAAAGASSGSGRVNGPARPAFHRRWRWRGRTGGLAIVLPAVVAMVGLRLVFGLFPVIDVVAMGSTMSQVGAGLVLTFVTVVQVAVFGWLLAGRWETPVLRTAVVAEMALSVAAVFAFGRMWIALPAIALVDVLLLLGGRVRVAVLFAGVGAYLVGLLRVHEGMSAVAGLAEFAMASLVLYLLPRLVLSIRELDEARRELTELAVARDRLRVARDLHDTLGQRLSVALLKLDLAKRAVGRDPVHAQGELDATQETLRRAIVEMQRVVSGLRSIDLDAELEESRDAMEAAGIDVRGRFGDVRMGETGAPALAWVIREATTNVLRHSSATWCAVEMDRVGDTVELRFRNDRPVARRSGQREGTGLMGLGERLREDGGELRVWCDEDVFELVARLPGRPA